MLVSVEIYTNGTVVKYQGVLGEVLSSVTTCEEAGVVVKTDTSGNRFISQKKEFVTRYEIRVFDGEDVISHVQDVSHKELELA